MSGRERRLFAAAAVAVVAALLVLLQGAPDERERAARGHARSSRPPTPARAPQAGPRDGRAAALRREHAARRRAAREDSPRRPSPRSASRGGSEPTAAARSFLRALLDFERARIGASTRRALRRASTRRLADLVLGAPPHVPQGTARPAPGWVVAIEPLRAGGARAELVATVRRGRQRSALLLELVREGGRWLVAALR